MIFIYFDCVFDIVPSEFHLNRMRFRVCRRTDPRDFNDEIPFSERLACLQYHKVETDRDPARIDRTFMQNAVYISGNRCAQCMQAVD